MKSEEGRYDSHWESIRIQNKGEITPMDNCEGEDDSCGLMKILIQKGIDPQKIEDHHKRMIRKIEKGEKKVQPTLPEGWEEVVIKKEKTPWRRERGEGINGMILNQNQIKAEIKELQEQIDFIDAQEKIEKRINE